MTSEQAPRWQHVSLSLSLSFIIKHSSHLAPALTVAYLVPSVSPSWPCRYPLTGGCSAVVITKPGLPPSLYIYLHDIITSYYYHQKYSRMAIQSHSLWSVFKDTWELYIIWCYTDDHDDLKNVHYSNYYEEVFDWNFKYFLFYRVS